MLWMALFSTLLWYMIHTDRLEIISTRLPNFLHTWLLQQCVYPIIFIIICYKQWLKCSLSLSLVSSLDTLFILFKAIIWLSRFWCWNMEGIFEIKDCSADKRLLVNIENRECWRSSFLILTYLSEQGLKVHHELMKTWYDYFKCYFP